MNWIAIITAVAAAIGAGFAAYKQQQHLNDPAAHGGNGHAPEPASAPEKQA